MEREDRGADRDARDENDCPVTNSQGLWGPVCSFLDCEDWGEETEGFVLCMLDTLCLDPGEAYHHGQTTFESWEDISI